MEQITIMWIILSVFISTTIGLAAYIIYNIKPEEEQEADIEEIMKLYSFFNNLLETKFEFYLNTNILPYLVNNKEIDKKDIIKIKNDFYTDISKTLSDDLKKRLLLVYSAQGIEFYIHQTFLSLMNIADIKFKDGGNNIDNTHKQTLNAIFKG